MERGYRTISAITYFYLTWLINSIYRLFLIFSMFINLMPFLGILNLWIVDYNASKFLVLFLYCFFFHLQVFLVFFLFKYLIFNYMYCHYLQRYYIFFIALCNLIQTLFSCIIIRFNSFFCNFTVNQMLLIWSRLLDVFSIFLVLLENNRKDISF